METNIIPKLTEYKISKGDFNEKEEVYIVELLPTNSFIKINKKTKNFIDEIDGEKSYSDIAESFNMKYKTNITEDMVRNIIDNKLAEMGLVEGKEHKRERILESRLWFHWNLLNGDKFEKLASKCTFLFNPIVMVFMLMISILSFAIVLSDVNLMSFMSKKQINYFQSVGLFVIFLMLLFTSILHEFGHIVASFKYNAKPRKVGIGLYLLMPVFFVDLSESWTLDRKKRCIIDLGGIYLQIISVLAYLPMIFCDNSLFNITNYKIIVYATLTNVLFNLNPTLKMDGYWALSDLTGVVNIHFRTKRKLINFVRKVLRLKIDRKEDYELTANAKKIFAIWSILYAAVTLLFVYIAINKLIVLVKSKSINIGLIILAFVMYMLFRVLVSLLRGKFNN